MFDLLIYSTIIISISFLIILLMNLNIKSKLINILFLLYVIIFIILILFLDYSFVLNFLTSLITYIYYPNYLCFVISILFSSFIFIYTLIKKNIDKKIKVLNYIFFLIQFSSYIIYQRLDIDLNTLSSIYSLKSLVMIRIVTISSLIFIILSLIFKVLTKKGEKNRI